MKTKIAEIFTSIQGEGPLIGYKQLFIRFCGCNLNCSYCDTKFDKGIEYDTNEVIQIIKSNKDCHSVSLTGGEPLLHTDFIKSVLPKCNLPVYLETNATLTDKLKEIIPLVKYIAADIKLPSCTGLEPFWEKHETFFKIAKEKELFAKVVFDKNITNSEIIKSANICKKYNIELILQPKMIENTCSITNNFLQTTLDKFLQHYPRTRLIPQVHKFINVK